MDDSLLATYAEEVAKFEINYLSPKIQNEYTRVRRYDRVRLDNFTADHTKINYGNYFDRLFTATNVKPPYTSFSQEYVIVEAPQYFKDLETQLANIVQSNKLRIFYNYM
jgi:hypothetical protein